MASVNKLEPTKVCQESRQPVPSFAICSGIGTSNLPYICKYFVLSSSHDGAKILAYNCETASEISVFCR